MCSVTIFARGGCGGGDSPPVYMQFPFPRENPPLSVSVNSGRASRLAVNAAPPLTGSPMPSRQIPPFGVNEHRGVGGGECAFVCVPPVLVAAGADDVVRGVPQHAAHEAPADGARPRIRLQLDLQGQALA